MLIIIGLAILFFIPIYYILKSKGYNAVAVCIIIGVVGYSAPIYLLVFENWPWTPLVNLACLVLSLVVAWALPAKKGAPGKAYLRIKCNCPECGAPVSFKRHEEGKAVLCPLCGEIMTVPMDEHSEQKTPKKRTKPSVTDGKVCFDSFGNEMVALELLTLFKGNGLNAEIIDGTGAGTLVQLGIDQGFKVIIDANDWDKAVELERQASLENKT